MLSSVSGRPPTFVRVQVVMAITRGMARSHQDRAQSNALQMDAQAWFVCPFPVASYCPHRSANRRLNEHEVLCAQVGKQAMGYVVNVKDDFGFIKCVAY